MPPGAASPVRVVLGRGARDGRGRRARLDHESRAVGAAVPARGRPEPACRHRADVPRSGRGRPSRRRGRVLHARRRADAARVRRGREQSPFWAPTVALAHTLEYDATDHGRLLIPTEPSVVGEGADARPRRRRGLPVDAGDGAGARRRHAERRDASARRPGPQRRHDRPRAGADRVLRRAERPGTSGGQRRSGGWPRPATLRWHRRGRDPKTERAQLRAEVQPPERRHDDDRPDRAHPFLPQNAKRPQRAEHPRGLQISRSAPRG